MLRDIKSSHIFRNLARSDKFNQRTIIWVANLVLVIAQFLYLLIRYKYLNDTIPIWYSMPWGDLALDYKRNIFILPILSGFILFSGLLINYLLRDYFARYLNTLLALIVSFANFAIFYSLIRIVMISSVPFPSLIDPFSFQLLLPFVIGFLVVFFITPKFISFADEHGLMTNPKEHFHPAMILTKPTARGGGVVFMIGFLVTTLLLVPLSKEIFGICLVAALLALLGLADDYQNTHSRSILKIFESPALRLFLMFVIVALVPVLGMKIGFVRSPFGGIWEFANLELFSSVITVFWIVWILNLLSWSNGIDGQYGGIIGIASIMLGLLALRFSPLLPTQLSYAKMAFIAAGASFGLVRYTWHPSKIMWGFSAVAAGAVLTTLSILVNAKTATSIVIILIPFLDAVVTFGRRIIQKKNPLKGDRGHLHHILLDRGWSHKKIAVFYWISTAVFGLIGILSSEKYVGLVTLTLSGIVASFIILLNLKSVWKQQASRLPER